MEITTSALDPGTHVRVQTHVGIVERVVVAIDGELVMVCRAERYAAAEQAGEEAIGPYLPLSSIVEIMSRPDASREK